MRPIHVLVVLAALLLSGCGDRQPTGPVLFHAISKDGRVELMMLKPDHSEREVVLFKNPASRGYSDAGLLLTGEFECAIDKAPKAAKSGSLELEPYDAHSVIRFDAVDDRKVFVQRAGEVGPMKEMTIEVAKADPILGPRIRLFLSDCEL
jgi:hypothetical protein